MVLDGKPTEKSTERRALNILTFEKAFLSNAVTPESFGCKILKGKKVQMYLNMNAIFLGEA